MALRVVGGLRAASRRGFRSWYRWLVWAVTGLSGSFVAIWLFGASAYTIGPFGVRIAVEPGSGNTSLLLPPLGAVSARTHQTPVRIQVEIRTLDVDSLQQLAAHSQDAAAAVAALRADLEHALRHFTLRLLVVGLLGAAGGALLMHRLSNQRYPIAALLTATAAAALALFLLLGLTGLSYDLDAFRAPDYSGVLEGAPWMFGLAQRALVEADRLGDRLAAIAEGLEAVFARVEQLEPIGARVGERAIIVASDIHSNPAGLEFLGAIADAFGAELVIDAGDLTDWGTAFEARLLREIQRVAATYVLVPGNHESPTLIAQVETLPNLRVIELGEIEVGGIRIAGVADPAASSSSPAVVVPRLRDAAAELRAFLDSLPTPPDLLVVHNPSVITMLADANALEGIPLIVSGHTHRSWIRSLGDSVWINPGTTGAAGLRGLASGRDVPYSLLVVHLGHRDGRWQPLTIDRIEVFNFQTGFTVERHVLPAADAEMPLP